MLVQLAKRARRTGRLIVLVLDNGSAHKSKRSSEAIEKLSRFVKVVWLPTYTSEQLNEIEGVWGHLKQDYFGRMLVKDRTKFYAAAVNLLTELKKQGALRRMLKPRCREKVRRHLLWVA
jgi:transposase